MKSSLGVLFLLSGPLYPFGVFIPRERTNDDDLREETKRLGVAFLKPKEEFREGVENPDDDEDDDTGFVEKY